MEMKRRKRYLRPSALLTNVEGCTSLLYVSFRGGHTGAVSGGGIGDAGDSGHNPAQPGTPSGGLGDAKRNNFYDDEEDEDWGSYYE